MNNYKDEVKKEVEKFINRLDLKYQNYLTQNQKKYKKYIDSLEYFYFITNYISTKSFPALDDEVVLLNLYTKASLDLYGIYYCLKFGLEVQAQQIARSLYETKITIELILREDTKERLKLFHDFQHIQRYKQLEFHRETSTEYDLYISRLKPKYIKSLEKNYESVKSNYHPKNPTHWAWNIFKVKPNSRNPTMLEICEYLGEDFVNEYVMTYPTASITSHPNQVIADYFTKLDTEKNKIVNSPNYTDLTKNISGISLGDCSKITIKILEYFKIPNYENIIEYIKHFVADALDFKYPREN